MMNKHLFSFIVSALCLIFSSGLMAQTTNWREVYKVKKKDTIYGIANQFGISIPDLVKANPEMAKEGYT
ncbi:LysM peptidoglycan-binding domain-containing protein [Segatella bryantii]|nr:LysM domain-containing protein [Segatella bryantii]UKK73944.1 LysM peptidoglycan-binding domain-containing protein [Segatella bryantii]